MLSTSVNSKKPVGRNMKLTPKVPYMLAASLLVVGISYGVCAAQEETLMTPQPEFNYSAEKFSDTQILRYQVKDFVAQPLRIKLFLYYLSQAALSGRDIAWDQNFRHNLAVRRTLEAIVNGYQGDRTAPEFAQFIIYLKRVWFANGIHHHYSNDKFQPEFSIESFKSFIAQSPRAHFPLRKGETLSQFIDWLTPIIFDPTVAPKKVSLDTSRDLVTSSSVNFYQGITEKEAKEFYEKMQDPADTKAPSYGLNSRLVKFADGTLKEEVYKIGGLYGSAITEIVGWLEKAVTVAESELQKKSLEKLIEYYRTGNLVSFDEYNILWVQDTQPVVDTINGFIEVYNDPLGMKGSWEAIVSIRDEELTKKYGVLSREAAWFEKNSPIKEEHKRAEVTGVSYKVIQVVMEAGDSSPSTPIGINLPNSNWIRKDHGSKSVSLGNIEFAYEEASKKSGVLEEFYLEKAQQDLIRAYGTDAAKLTTGLHEVVGHASGRIMPGVGSPSQTLGAYASTLEEARADLVALYYIGDQHLVDLALVASTDVMKAEYISYLTNGLLKQLARVELSKPGEPEKVIEESHMRNRQMISNWILERGAATGAVELRDVQSETGVKSYIIINDYARVRALTGELLREVQRIKSEGDSAAGKQLVERYGVKIDRRIHEQVKRRWDSLGQAPYKGFINPSLRPVLSKSGEISDIAISYPTSFSGQMLDYARNYSFLPTHS